LPSSSKKVLSGKRSVESPWGDKEKDGQNNTEEDADDHQDYEKSEHDGFVPLICRNARMQESIILTRFVKEESF